MTQTAEEAASTALAKIPVSDVLPVLADPRHVLSAEQVKRQAGLLQQVMEAVMVPGVHWGTVDGKPPKSRTLGRTHDDDKQKKETLMLYQPGAEKLMLTFCLRPEYGNPEVVSERSERGGFLSITTRCKLLHVGTGVVVGEALGNCNSRERKYRWRTVYTDKAQAWEREQGRLEVRPSKNGGTYEVIVLEVDPWEIYQTILAQSQKRAMVRAVRTALAAGDLLGVDEDQAQALRDFASEHAEDAEVVLGSEDQEAANNLRSRARAAAAGDAPPPADAPTPQPLTQEQQALAEAQEQAAALSKRLARIEGYTAADYKQLVRGASEGRTHEPGKLTLAELRRFIPAAELVLKERGADVQQGAGAPAA